MRSADRRTADRHAELSNEERRQLAESVAALRSAYGPRWTRVPYGFGDQAQRARKILSTGPLAIKPDAADPVRTVQELGAFAQETADMAARLLEQVSYLGEALGADVTALPLARLRRLSRAVLRLAEAPVPEPSWAFPSQAHAASMTLSALGDDLREVGALRRELYEAFSEDVWTLACAKNPPPVDRWWQSARRCRVRRRLASVTRHGRPKTDVKRAIAVLRRTNELETNIEKAWTAASDHLGYFADAGIPDVDGAAEALAAIHDLQLALGDRLDPAKVRNLAAGVAVGSCFGLVRYASGAQDRAVQAAEPVPVMVAMKDVPEGMSFSTAWNEGRLALSNIPKTLRPDTAVVDPNALAGFTAASPLAQRQLLVQPALIKPDARTRVGPPTLAAQLPDGTV